MSEKEYESAKMPTDRDYEIRALWIKFGRDLQKTAFALGEERQTVLRAICAVRWHLQDAYNDRYEMALDNGFSQSDARLHAQQEVAYREANRK